MNLNSLLRLFADNNCEQVYVKRLVRNNNSKQQIYVARGMKMLNMFPLQEFREVSTESSTTLQARCTFFWLTNDGNKFLAPNAKFILYPKYPEIRFSGFVEGCDRAPSESLNNQVEGRLLFLGVSKTNEIIGYVSDPESEISIQFSTLKDLPQVGVFYVLTLEDEKVVYDDKTRLLKKLKSINLKGWIDSKELKPGHILTACNGNRCGGLTLEAEFGIIQNGRSEPDYLGWEIKQFGLKSTKTLNGGRITLMTPEPDGGWYKQEGGISFVRKYGYPSPSVRDRMDFTGIHKYGILQDKSKLTMKVNGYDPDSNIITDLGGSIDLIDPINEIAASWSFSKMLTHWNKKHAKAAYVPSSVRYDPHYQFYYWDQIMLGEGTDFLFFLKSVGEGKVFYDPGIHIDNVSTRATLKPRSQFRIYSQNIKNLYSGLEIIDLTRL